MSNQQRRRHVMNLNFPTAVDAVVSFDDGTIGHLSGVRAVQWRNVVETLSTYVRDHPDAILSGNDELMDLIRRALEGDIG